MQKTALYNQVVKAGGKIVDFHGWEMPVQFSGIINEYNAVRESAGIFDVSHMGQIYVDGPDAHKFLQHINCNNISAVPGQGTYSHLLNEHGRTVDDVIAFCLEESRFLVVVNSANADKDYAWFTSHAKKFKVKITNSSDDYGMVAVQGPDAPEYVEKLVEEAQDLERFQIMEKIIFGSVCYISRTGYTGEDGFEIMVPSSSIEKVWTFFIDLGVTPCGLGARDVLRLEAKYLLHGSDIDENHTPYEAGAGWVVKLDKGEFIGRAALVKQKAEGIKQKLTYFEVTGGVPRGGFLIFKDGKQIGALTSGTYSPEFKGIACGYVNEILEPGTEVEIDNQGRKMKGEVVKKFYNNKV